MFKADFVRVELSIAKKQKNAQKISVSRQEEIVRMRGFEPPRDVISH